MIETIERNLRNVRKNWWSSLIKEMGLHRQNEQLQKDLQALKVCLTALHLIESSGRAIENRKSWRNRRKAMRIR